MRRGTGLLDLVVVLALLAVVATIAAPRLAEARDAYAARAARDAAVSLVERARSLAAARGRARLIIDAPAAVLRLESPAGVGEAVLDAGRAFGVQLAVDGAANTTVNLDFNGLGLGVLANRTIRFRRGKAEAAVALSTHGRPRRW